MKFLSNIVSFVLTAHLLVATSGVPLVYHFCGEKMESVSIGTAKQCDCKHEDADNQNACCEKDCCHNEVTLSKIESDFLIASSPVTLEFLATPLVAILPFSCATPPQPPVCAITLAYHSLAHRSSDIPILFHSLLI